VSRVQKASDEPTSLSLPPSYFAMTQIAETLALFFGNSARYESRPNWFTFDTRSTLEQNILPTYHLDAAEETAMQNTSENQQLIHEIITFERFKIEVLLRMIHNARLQGIADNELPTFMRTPYITYENTEPSDLITQAIRMIETLVNSFYTSIERSRHRSSPNPHLKYLR